MKHILKVNNLVYNNKIIGFVGLNLETGELKKYSTVDYECNFKDNILFEINANLMPPCTLKYLVETDKIAGRNNSIEALPIHLRPDIERYIKLQADYNRVNNFTNEELMQNIKNLEIKYRTNLYDSKLYVSGIYYLAQNTISLSVNKRWDQLTESEIQKVKDVLLHEIGHMGVSKYSFDSSTKTVSGHIGLIPFYLNLKPLCVTDNEFCYITDTKYTEDDFVCLEETINEFECLRMKPNYICGYPKYGHLLNEISDGSLIQARHLQDPEEYFRVMLSIIDDESYAYELLDAMNLSLKSRNSEDIGHAMQMLKKYEFAKASKRS